MIKLKKNNNDSSQPTISESEDRYNSIKANKKIINQILNQPNIER